MRFRQGVLALALTLTGLPPVWADEADTAALKAEVEVLKDRLARLESQLAQATLQGGVEMGEKPIPGLLQLPSGLQGLQMSGYADVSYIYNFNEPDPTSGTSGAPARTNRGRAFDNEPNGFTPHALELVLEKPITDEMPFGFRTDLFVGDDAEVFGAGTGLGLASDEIELQQAYIAARTPVEGLEVKVGKFVTLLGAEVIESPANWNFSRSYMFNYAIPFTHTGVLASYPLGELGSATLGVVNGWERVDDNNKAKSILGNITLTPLDSLTVSSNLITGAEQTGDSRNKRTVISNVITWTPPIERLTLMADYDYGHESGLVQGTGARGFEAANWQGLALYGKYDLTDTWSLAGRGVGRDTDVRDRVGVGRHGRARVEPEPPQPEDEAADRGQAQIVAGDGVDRAVLAILAEPRPQDDRPRQRGPPADRVDDGRAREVPHPQLRQPPAAPDPMAGHRIDEPDHQEGEEDEREVLHPLRDRPGDDRRRRPGEDELEEELRQQGHARPADRAVGPLVGVTRGRGVVGAAEHPEALGAEERRAVAEHQPPPEEPERHRGDREHDEVLREDVHAVLLPGEASFQTPEAGVHPEHQHRSDERPYRIRHHLRIHALLLLVSDTSFRCPKLVSDTSGGDAPRQAPARRGALSGTGQVTTT